MSLHLLGSVVILLALSACRTTSTALTPQAIVELEAPSSAAGQLIYTGRVVPEGHETAAFHYERWVEGQAKTWTSTHVTFASGSPEPVVAQRALHSSDYTLQHFEEIHRQTGVVSSVRVRQDGGLEFSTTKKGRTHTRSEGVGAPVVVGPTLFGHVLSHWDALLDGEALAVRFAATDRGRSYPFTLRLVETTTDTTTIAFAASSPLVRMSIDTMHLVFDTSTKTIRRYVGRVPPRLDRGKVFDARVDYEFAASRYR